ncbi:MAG: EamA family transporter [Candidatus Omnitrophica bacterium]|nr:EamA family transporter [Candidatus Omnitrophota bacterium]
MNEQGTIYGGVLCALGYIFLAVMSGASKYLQEISGIPAIEITFFSYFFVLLASLPWIFMTGPANLFKSPYIHLVLTRTFLGTLTYYLYFITVDSMPLVTAVTLINTAPFWVALLAAILLGERVGKAALGFIAAGFTGVVMVIGPTSRGMNARSVLLALLVGVLAASVIVCRRSLKDESWQRTVAVYSLLATLLTGIAMAPSFTMPSGWEWIFVACIGACMYAMQALVQLAARYARASTLGPISYASIVASGMIGWLVWGHVPTLLETAGILLIIASGVVILLSEKRRVSAPADNNAG